MARSPRIVRVQVHQFAWEVPDMGTDYNGFNQVYQAGNVLSASGHVLTVETDLGVTGEFVGGVELSQLGVVGPYLVGRNPLERELIYNDLKRALRKNDRLIIGPIDIALWDFAGKLYGAPIYEMLGGFRKQLPAYASTYHGDEAGGLGSPEAFADFGVECKERGFPAFKIHPWGRGPIAREVANVLAVRKAVGPAMDLMIDPACEYNTFADALRVGRACDEASFFWYEDPYKDGGISQFAHRKLRQLIRTPLLIGEHVRTLEPHVDLVVAEATDFVRVDAYMDGGLTGALKIAHAAEGFGLDAEIHGGGPAHRHLMASIRNTNYYELGLLTPKLKRTHAPVYKDLSLLDELESADGNGRVSVPEGPGLGAEIDWEWVRKHEVGVVTYEA
jgi:L-alanine-DL-glutamate epimerase-like enolase superfamily enzyme